MNCVYANWEILSYFHLDVDQWISFRHSFFACSNLDCFVSLSVHSKSINTRVSSVCTLSSVSMSSATHIKARCTVYPGSDKHRFPVPDDKVSWATVWPDYSPVNYTAPSVLQNPAWADPDIGCVLVFTVHF